MTKFGTVAFFVAALVFLASSFDAFVGLRHGLAALRFHMDTRAPTGDVVLVDIDAKSLGAVGTWPWPRSVHASIIDRLMELGASEIAFDIDFSARSNPQDDQVLEDALERAGGGIVLAVFTQPLTSASGETVVHNNRPIDRFRRHAWSAAVNVFPDSDGMVRKFPFGLTIDGESVLSVPALLGGHFGRMDGLFPIDFGIRANEIDRISVIDLLGASVSRDRVEGRKVIVGASAAELRDNFAVPVYGVITGPLMQALAAETILQDRALVATGPLVGGFGLAVLVLLAIVFVRKYRWSSAIALIFSAAMCVEVLAIAAHWTFALDVDTSQWHVCAATLIAFIVLREIDLRRLLLFVSRRDVRNTRTILDQVIADNLDGVVVIGEDRRISFSSRMAARILLGNDEKNISGRAIGDVLPVEMVTAVDKVFGAPATADTLEPANDQPMSECRFSGKGQREPLTLEFVATPSRLEGGIDQYGRETPDRQVVCLTFRDITEKRKSEDQLAYLARNDKLTGLANRNAFIEHVDIAAARVTAGEKGGAVVCFDLNRLRTVNDTLGHEAGDKVLKATAERAAGILGRDAILARFGADEFAILLNAETSRVAALKLCEELVEAISRPMQLGPHSVAVGASAGVAMIRDPGIDAERLIQDASIALMRAKAEAARPVRLFDPALGAEQRQRREIESELWTAFEDGQFQVVYQPQFHLASGRLDGVEALVRWNHPTRGAISPALFVPVAESTGFIERLGAHVLSTSCREVASWPQPIRLAVNISQVQFARGNVLLTVAEALEASRLAANRLDLELTESILMEDSEQIGDVLARLRKMGVGLALDDFGTGYSSIDYVRRLPIDKIKIDRAFVKDLPADQPSLAIIRAVVALAEGLHVKTTVEGIETREQANLMRLCGCTQGQGYFYGKPQSGSDIRNLMRAPLQAVGGT